MFPAFWFTIQIKRRRIALPFPVIFPLVLVMEILAILPAAIYAVWKKETLPLKFVSGLYLSRLVLAFILYGRRFKVSVCDGSDRVQIGGRRWKVA